MGLAMVACDGESDGGGGYTNGGFGINAGDDDEDYGPRGGANRVVTRLVVSRMHVGCLLGKGGKIIEQMRIETKTHIRILPRDHNLPRCVQMSEEIVQVLVISTLTLKAFFPCKFKNFRFKFY